MTAITQSRGHYASMEKQPTIYVLHGGSIKGPYSEAEISELVEVGAFAPEVESIPAITWHDLAALGLYTLFGWWFIAAGVWDYLHGKLFSHPLADIFPLALCIYI